MLDATPQEKEFHMVAAASPNLFPRELDYRCTDGVEVSLLWSKPTNRLWVAVYDGRTDDWFELDVRPDNATDVFNHPYAYAASRGVEYHELIRAAA